MRNDRGFTLIELMIVVVIIGLLGSMAVPLYGDAIRKSQQQAIVTDSKRLFEALMGYYADYGKFPSEDDFDVETFAPLSTEGYFPGARSLLGKIVGNRALIYVAPDVDGRDDQFILVMRAEFDADVIPVVVHTNIIAATEGWVSGVYLIDDGDLEEADEI